MMTSSHVAEHYTAFLDDALAPAQRRMVEAHLRDCPQCAAEVAELRQLLTDLRTLPTPAVPAHFTAGVRARLQRRPLHRPFPWLPVSVTGGSLATAAALLLVLLHMGGALRPDMLRLAARPALAPAAVQAQPRAVTAASPGRTAAPAQQAATARAAARPAGTPAPVEVATTRAQQPDIHAPGPLSAPAPTLPPPSFHGPAPDRIEIALAPPSSDIEVATASASPAPRVPAMNAGARMDGGFGGGDGGHGAPQAPAMNADVRAGSAPAPAAATRAITRIVTSAAPAPVGRSAMPAPVAGPAPSSFAPLLSLPARESATSSLPAHVLMGVGSARPAAALGKAAGPARASVQATAVGAVSVAITARPGQGDQLVLRLSAQVHGLTLAYAQPPGQGEQRLPLYATPMTVVVDLPLLTNGAMLTLTLRGETRTDQLCLVIPAAAPRAAMPAAASAHANEVATVLRRFATEHGDYVLCPSACLAAPAFGVTPTGSPSRTVRQIADGLGCRLEINGRVVNLQRNSAPPAGK